MSINNILLDIAPELEDIEEAHRLRIIDIASNQVNFGSKPIKDLATAYLAAHMLTISKRSGNSGPISSEKEGDLSRNFGGAVGSGYYNSTSYGLEFKRLARAFIFGPRTSEV